MSKKAIIVGASSGIGRSLAMILSKEGYTLGLMARRKNLLESLQQVLPGPSVVEIVDIADGKKAQERTAHLIHALGGLDLFIANAAIGPKNEALDFEPDEQTIFVNVLGFVAVTTCALRYFIQQKHGHLVGISSLGAYFRSGEFAAYMASKAFISSYMGSLRVNLRKTYKEKMPIYITDIKPGFVDTPLVDNMKQLWVVPADRAAADIYHAITKKKEHAYIPKRWALFGCVFKHAPECFWKIFP